MSGIVPYEDDGLRKPYSAGDAPSFLEYLYKKGRLIKVLLYVVTSLIFLLMYAYTVQYTLGTEFGSFSSGLIAFAFIVFLGFVFAFPAIPRQYRYQFKGKFRPDILEDELSEQLNAATATSLEFAALIIIAISVLSIGVLGVAGILSFPALFTLIPLSATAIDTGLISLVLISLGQSNREFLRKTLREEEYLRYTSIGNNKRIFVVLAIVNALAVIFLYLAW